MNLNNFFKNNIKDIIIILLITVCICIFIHLLNCSDCDTNTKKKLDNIDKEIEKFLKNLYFVKNNIESFQNPTLQDRQNAKIISALQENYIIENVDNIKKLLNVDIKINDLNERVSRILDRINSKYESTINKKIFINTNGDISIIDV
jgi:uncharacterized membrane protein